MGTFDTVNCLYPLPEKPEWVSDFQTKDLECNLGYYIIDAGGNLMKTGYTGLEGEKKEERTELVQYSGTLYLFAWEAGKGSCEYTAEFVNGRLVLIFRNRLTPPKTLPGVR